ncbi:MAG: TetR/AcrR family transcriptional regulator [Promethearchaeota archaeon]
MNEKNDVKKNRKQRETELRRQIIMETAEKLFLSEGYDKTTMDSIARYSEYSKGTLYNYFSSKDELYLSIGSKAYEIIIDYTKKFTEKHSPGIEQLKAVGYAYYEFTKEYPSYATIFHDIFIKIPDLDTKPKKDLTEIEKNYLNNQEQYGNFFVSLITNAIISKGIRTDKNPILIGFTLFMVTSGVMKEIEQHQKTINTNPALNPDQIIDLVFEMMGEGLKPRDE